MPGSDIKVLIACDKFKGSIPAERVCRILAEGIQQVHKETKVILLPMADGGEGSGELVSSYLNLTEKRVKTVDAAGKTIWVRYAADDKGRAYLESSRVIGPRTLTADQKNPMYTHSFGLGLVIRKLIKKGIKEFHIFLGGSSTNDGGSGMLEALGWKFYDKNGNIVHPSGGNLKDIHRVENPSDEWTKGIRYIAWCDVDIPLLGEEGCSYMFAGQKGAGPADIVQLEKGMEHFSRLSEQVTGNTGDRTLPGAGSAGGLGFGIKNYLDGQLKKGVDFFAEQGDLSGKIQEADLIITGEGRFDHQSIKGKVASKVISTAVLYKKPCIVVCGENTLDEKEWKRLGVCKVFSILELSGAKDAAMSNPAKYLHQIGQETIKT